MEREEVFLTKDGVETSPLPPSPDPALALIKASTLATRWGCSKPYLTKLKSTHGFDPSSFKTLDEADAWLKKHIPSLHSKYVAGAKTPAKPKAPKPKPVPAALKPITPPPAAPAAGSAMPPVSIPGLAPVATVAVVPTEEDFFDPTVAQARIACEQAFAIYQYELAAAASTGWSKAMQNALDTHSSALDSYNRVKKLHISIQKDAKKLVDVDKAKTIIQEMVATWMTLLDALASSVVCSETVRENIRKEVLNIKKTLTAGPGAFVEKTTTIKPEGEEEAPGDEAAE